MDRYELAQLISLGEGLHLEFKRRVPRAERIAKEVIALANTEGGRLILGVNDDGTIAGLRDAIEEEFVLRRALDDYCHPPVVYSTARINVGDGIEVILVVVPESRDKPHVLLDSTGDGTAYVRAGEMSVEASPESVRLMHEEQEPQAARFEFGDNELLLMRYLDNYSRVTVPQFAQIAGISEASASETLLQLTRASILEIQVDRGEDYFILAANNH